MYYENNRKPRRFRRTSVAAIILGIIIAALIIISFSTASTKRWFKNLWSDYTGGLNRVVTVYDNNGNELRTYTGNIDIQENSYGNKVLFDLDGKRIVLYNAVVIAEEQ